MPSSSAEFENTIARQNTNVSVPYYSLIALTSHSRKGSMFVALWVNTKGGATDPCSHKGLRPSPSLQACEDHTVRTNLRKVATDPAGQWDSVVRNTAWSQDRHPMTKRAIPCARSFSGIVLATITVSGLGNRKVCVLNLLSKCMCVCLSVCHKYVDTHRSHKRGYNTVELELQAIMSHST